MLATEQFGQPLTFIVWTKPEYLFCVPQKKKKSHTCLEWNKVNVERIFTFGCSDLLRSYAAETKSEIIFW